jgi:hypothetical protein
MTHAHQSAAQLCFWWESLLMPTGCRGLLFLGTEASSDPDTVQTRLVQDTFRAPVFIGLCTYLGA